MPPKKQPWFRFYVEAVRDRKLRRLSPAHRWLWVTVLACAKESPVPGYLLLTESEPISAEDLADAAALKTSEVKSGLGELGDLGLIDRDPDFGCWHIRKWNERQFESDDTAMRTAKHRSKEQRKNVPTPVDVTPPETEAETDTELVPTEPALPTSNGRRDMAIASKYLQRLEPILASGSSFDLLHEFRELWEPAWQEAIDQGITPTSVGRNLLATFIATVTDHEPDYGRAGQLVGRYGKLALLGIDEGLIANADDPYRYAHRVCSNQSAAHRSEL